MHGKLNGAAEAQAPRRLSNGSGENGTGGACSRQMVNEQIHVQRNKPGNRLGQLFERFN
jgi:hypothetical protein